MTLIGWLQISVVLAIIVATAWPVGAYMARVFGGERTPLTRIIRPVETWFHRAAGINAAQAQTWLGYTLSMLVFQAVGFLTLYGLPRTQGFLPLNPQVFPNVAPDLAFNTAMSFLTNTDWQAYAGEQTMSHLTQMAGLAVHNFLSAATGIALAIALTRAFARNSVATLGNF